MTARLLQGHCLEELAKLEAESVHCCVTSPPYWGLRDYGSEPVSWPGIEYSPLAGIPPCVSVPAMESSLGLEPTLEAFIGHLVLVFREVRRVLRKDGTLWLNMGDSYAGTRDPNARHSDAITSDKIGSSAIAAGAMKARKSTDSRRRDRVEIPRSDLRTPGLKSKDMVAQPWRLALALQADGWWLRRDIIWSKLNPMPESCSDRPTTAHEYVFLLSRSERYHFDAAAVREPVGADTHARYARGRSKVHKNAEATLVPGSKPQTIANGFEHMRAPSGWDVSTGAGDHGAFHVDGRRPTAWDNDLGSNRTLIDGYARQPTPKAQNNGVGFGHGYDKKPKRRVKNNESFDQALREQPDTRNIRSVWTLATEPYSEAHFATFPSGIPKRCILAGCPVDGTVLDPFNGSGTTGQAALELVRNYVGIELKPDYLELTDRRLAGITPGLPFERGDDAREVAA